MLNHDHREAFILKISQLNKIHNDCFTNIIVAFERVFQIFLLVKYSLKSIDLLRLFSGSSIAYCTQK